MAGKKRKGKKRAVKHSLSTKTAKPDHVKRSTKPMGETARSSKNMFEELRGMLLDDPGVIFVMIIAFVGVLAYLFSLNGAFVFDDRPNIVDNPAIYGIGSAITDTFHSRVIGFITFALNYKIHGLEVEGYHIFNLVIHLVCALLVFWLVTLTFKTPFFKGSILAESRLTPLIVALFASLVFIAHPVQTQAVSYTVQRFTSLATLFYLLSLALYAKWRLATDRPEGHSIFVFKVTVDLGVKKAFFYTAALIAALLAMLTKEIAFTLPVIVALWEFAFFNGPLKRRALNLLPFAFTLPVIPLALAGSRASLTSAGGTMEPPPAVDYFLTQLRVIVTYLRLLVLPLGQNLDYDYPVYRSFLNPNVLLSFIFLLAFAGLGVFLWRYSKKGGKDALLRLAAFGIFWFFITLSVESSFITIADVIFEHRLYLPSFGIVMAAVGGAVWATFALKERFPAIDRVAISLGAIVVVVLAVATFERNKVWADPIALWEDTAAKSPGKARPHNNLGVSYESAGQTDKAEIEFKRAVDLYPEYPDPYKNLGVYYMKKEQYEEALQYFLKSLELDPENYVVHNDLGNAYAMQQQFNEARAEFQEALRLKPDYQKAIENMQILEEIKQ